MKLNYILASIVAAASFMLIGCQKDQLISSIPNVECSSTCLYIPTEGGTATATFKSTKADWIVDTAALAEKASWLTVSPIKGKAGEEVKISFTAPVNTDSERKVEVDIMRADSLWTQIITVTQGGSEPKASTCKDVIEGKDGTTFKVQGVVSSKGISNHYGNWYIKDDTGEVYVYGTLDKKGNANSSGTTYDNLNDPNYENSWSLSVGDLVTIIGPKKTYNGTIELVDVTMLEIISSLLEVNPMTAEMPKEGGTVELSVIYKGDNLDVEPLVDWISLSRIDIKADTSIVVLKVDANVDDTRKGLVNLTSTKGDQSTVVPVEISQKSGLAAYPLPYVEKFDAGLGAWMSNDVVNPDKVTVWKFDESYKVLKGTGYADSKNHDTEVELISPLIDLTNAKSAVLSFDHAYRYGTNKYAEMKLMISVDNGVTWSVLPIPDYGPADKSYTMTTNTVSLTRYVGGLAMVKFIYKSTTTGGPTWEIKNFSVSEGEVTISNIAQLNSFICSTSKDWSGTFTNAVVSYVDGGNAFIEDATGGIQLYLKNHTFKAGDVINGAVSGKGILYAGYPELTALTCTAIAGTAPAPTEIQLSDVEATFPRYLNCYLILKGVTFDTAITAANRNGVISKDGKTLAVYSQNKNLNISGTGDLTCTGGYYNGTIRVGVWSEAQFVK